MSSCHMFCQNHNTTGRLWSQKYRYNYLYKHNALHICILNGNTTMWLVLVLSPVWVKFVAIGWVAIFSFDIKRNLNPVSSILVRDIKQCINKENISFLYIMTFLYIRMWEWKSSVRTIQRMPRGILLICSILKIEVIESSPLFQY